MNSPELSPEIQSQVQSLVKAVTREVGRIFIGPEQTVELLLTAIVARGHVLLEGVPGVAKTTLCKAFAGVLGCSFRRIQFTPDLLPSDITGTYVLDMRTSQFSLREGPIFAHVVLGDEINRAPAKTQSALLEAMQERQVTIEGETRPLAAPFLVLATQNPLEHAGTYPLPEAQIDRFLFKLTLGYPSPADELRMLETHERPPAQPTALLSPDDLVRLSALADRVHATPEIHQYVFGLVRHTRQHRQIGLGASPRAGLALLVAAKARALIEGRNFVLPDDVQALATAVLAHRLVITPDAELDGITGEKLIAEALERVPVRPIALPR